MVKIFANEAHHDVQKLFIDCLVGCGRIHHDFGVQLSFTDVTFDILEDMMMALLNISTGWSTITHLQGI